MSQDPAGASADELAELSQLVGAPVLAAERRRWGFENDTRLVTLADGRLLIVQRLSVRAAAQRAIQLGYDLPERLAAAGLRTPRQLAADASVAQPYAVREYIPGQIGASSMGDPAGVLMVARAMGALLPQLARVPAAGLGLADDWADPRRLAHQAKQQLERCRALLGPAGSEQLRATIGQLREHFAGRPGVFAHGDFCPVNVLLEQGRATALIDLEFARIADRLFDVAWWGWVVRYHHPAGWAAAWPVLLETAGITASAANATRVRILQQLRCLEMLDYHAHTPAAAASWAERLHTTLAWDG